MTQQKCCSESLRREKKRMWKKPYAKKLSSFPLGLRKQKRSRVVFSPKRMTLNRLKCCTRTSGRWRTASTTSASFWGLSCSPIGLPKNGKKRRNECSGINSVWEEGPGCLLFLNVLSQRHQGCHNLFWQPKFWHPEKRWRVYWQWKVKDVPHWMSPPRAWADLFCHRRRTGGVFEKVTVLRGGDMSVGDRTLIDNVCVWGGTLVGQHFRCALSVEWVVVRRGGRGVQDTKEKQTKGFDEAQLPTSSLFRAGHPPPWYLRKFVLMFSFI